MVLEKGMSLLGGNDLKEQQKINELELKINREKQKLDKSSHLQQIFHFLLLKLKNCFARSIQGGSKSLNSKHMRCPFILLVFGN